MRFAFLAKQRHTRPVSWLCEVLEVSLSGFHAWLTRPLGNRAIRDAKLVAVIDKSFKASDRTYGACRVWHPRHFDSLAGRSARAVFAQMEWQEAQGLHPRSAGNCQAAARRRIIGRGGSRVSSAFDRRSVLAGLAACALPHAVRSAGTTFRLGLTPVFLDNDAIVIKQLRETLRLAMAMPIDLVQRRTYQEVTALLLDGAVDAAWLCGYPYLQHKEALSLAGVPVWRGRPLYRSYLIVAADDAAAGLLDLEGGSHAFSDPDSNSGWLVTASDLVRMGRTPEDFFARTIFTYGHRNVVRAVASGLTRSGSVDGYVWEVLAEVEPDLAGTTRVVARSEWLGFPPVAIRADRRSEEAARRFGDVLRSLADTEHGRTALRLLHLDGFAPGDPALFDGIAARMRDVERLR